MTHPFSPSRVVFLSAAPGGFEELSGKLAGRLTEIDVPDYVLVHHFTRQDLPYQFGIHVALAQYAPARLVTTLEQNEALEDGEDLDYFEGQGMDEEELAATLNDKILTLLTDKVDADDLEGCPPEEFHELIRSGEWTWTKIVRSGIYSRGGLTDADIVAELGRRP